MKSIADFFPPMLPELTQGFGSERSRKILLTKDLDSKMVSETGKPQSALQEVPGNRFGSTLVTSVCGIRGHQEGGARVGFLPPTPSPSFLSFFSSFFSFFVVLGIESRLLSSTIPSYYILLT